MIRPCLVIALAAAPRIAAAQAPGQSSPEALKDLFVDFGVPSTPALAFLPSAAPSVTHVVTPKDLQAQAVTLFQGLHLQSGVALDARLFNFFSSSLSAYQSSALRQALFRTVVSLGTAPAGKDSKDVVLGLGVRVPVMDLGDPRANATYTTALESSYATTVAAVARPSVADLTSPQAGQVIADYQDRVLRAGQEAADSIRRTFRISHWNALRTDLGFAVTVDAPGGSVKPTALVRQRLGGWVAVAFPVSPFAEGTVSGSGWWARADSLTAETARDWAGAAVRAFLRRDSFAVRAEASRVWSRYRDSPALNERWSHAAVGVEVKVPLLGGWVNVAWGGETAHRGTPGANVALRYAVFQNQQNTR